MNMDLIGEVLARLADHVPDLEWPEMVRDWEKEPALAELAHQIKEALRPVEPAAAFRQRLERELASARLARPIATPTHSLMNRRNILVGTAAVGSLASAFSILGLAILLLRRRLTARPASQGPSSVSL